MTLTDFACVGGLVQGRDHRRMLRDGQDGLAAREGEHGLGLAVTDGCGSALHSEVGARLGAAWLAAQAPTVLKEHPSTFAQHLSTNLCSFLEKVVCELEGSGGRSAIVGEMFLFSFVCAVVTGERVIVVGRGDGLVDHNGRRACLTAGDDNAPDYLGYELTSGGVESPEPSSLPTVRRASRGTQVLVDARTEDLRSLVLATDGLFPLAEQPEAFAALRDGALAAKSPAWMLRRLRVLAERGPLRDDTAVIALGRRPS
jgi:serine/threonine protein phosphatase PrpC